MAACYWAVDGGGAAVRGSRRNIEMEDELVGRTRRQNSIPLHFF